MPTFRRRLPHFFSRSLAHALATLLCALVATAASAQEETTDSAGTNPTWRESAIARCQQQYSAEQCQDEQFLEENFHVGTLEVAHRAAARRNQLERAARRELTLQRVCNRSTSSTCAGSAQPAQCAAQITQQCSALRKEVAYCLNNAKTQCAKDGLGRACVKEKITRCPSVKKQPIEAFLAKYPKLKPEQKVQLARTAQQLDAQQGRFINLFDWIGL